MDDCIPMGYEAISLLEALNGLTVAPRRSRPRRRHSATAVPVEAVNPTIEETVINVTEENHEPTSAAAEDIENDAINEESTSESFAEAVQTL